MMFSVNQMLRGLGRREDEKMNFKAIARVYRVLRQGTSLSL